MSSPTSPRLLLAVALLSVAFVALLPSAPYRAKRRACPPPPPEASCATPVEEESPSAEPVEEEVPAAEPVEEAAPCAAPTAEEAPASEPAAEAAPCAVPAAEEAPGAEPAASKPGAAPAEALSEASSETAVLTGRRSSARPAAAPAFDPAQFPWAPADRRAVAVWDWDGATEQDRPDVAVQTRILDQAMLPTVDRSELRIGSAGEGILVAVPRPGDSAPAELRAAVREALERLAAAFPDRTLRVRWPDEEPASTEGR